MVDNGLNMGRVGLSSEKVGGCRLQLGTEAAPGQLKLEEGGGPSRVQRAGGGMAGVGCREEGTWRAPEGRLAAGLGGGLRGPRSEGHVGRS